MNDVSQEKMKAIVKPEAAPGLEMRQVPVPQVGPGEVKIEVEAASICGTDYHIYRWDEWSASRIHPPLIIGHEFAGTVVEVGEGVEEVSVGDYVSAESHTVCNRCYQCQTGQSHVCQDVSIIGVDVDGAFAEYVVLPEQNIWFNDEDLDPALASIQEPMGNAVHTVLSAPIAGKSTLITGAGPLGLMALEIAKGCGAGEVFITEVNEYRLDLARELGVDMAINPLERDPVETIVGHTGGGVDVALEMSGNPVAIRQAFQSLRSGGRVSLLGIPEGKVEMDITNDIVFKGATVYGISGRKIFETWHQGRALLEAGRIDLEPIITHRLPFEDFEKGMELMADKECGKVVLMLD